MTTALTNLYVRNLPMEWTAADLIALGEKYGPVVSAKVLYNPLTTASRGMGFIRFAEHADATLAIAGMNGHIPDSAVHAKPLNVQFAKDQQVGGGTSTRSGGDGTRYSPYPTAKRAAGSTDSSGAAVGFVESLPVAPEGTDPLNVYVVDLPLTFTKEEFQALYEPFGCLVTSTVLTDPTSGQSRGIGFARYSNTDNAARALKETQGMMLPAAVKPLLVRFARDSSRKHEEQTNTTLHRLHGHHQHQQPQQPVHPQHAAYTSSYAQHYPYAPAYAAGPAYYPPQYPPQLTSPAHRSALPTPPPPPNTLTSAHSAPSSANPSSSYRPNTQSAAPTASLPAPAAADSSSAASAAAYQQAWAAYYAQLGYPGYYTGYQYPTTATAPYPTPPYPYSAHTAPPAASPAPITSAVAAPSASSSLLPSASAPPSTASSASAQAATSDSSATTSNSHATLTNGSTGPATSTAHSPAANG